LESTLTPEVRRVAAGEVELSIREWRGDGRSFLLVHGLASNAMTWELVARRLQASGHWVVSVDQRGHGASDKPEGGYGFAEVTADLKALIETLAMDQPIIAGQSWGGNVVLEFAARYPGHLAGLVLVDGGLIDLSGTPGATWDQIAVNLKPPNLLGTARQALKQRFHSFHPSWSDEQVELQMGNYETLEDGTIRPWLSLERHMMILRALWDQQPSLLFEDVKTPTLIALADSGPEQRRITRAEEAERLEATRDHVKVRRFIGAAHDIHVDRPDELSDWILSALAEGFFD
jgi:pimeloyl-ACP methyl ester carboxylesterase